MATYVERLGAAYETSGSIGIAAGSAGATNDTKQARQVAQALTGASQPSYFEQQLQSRYGTTTQAPNLQGTFAATYPPQVDAATAPPRPYHSPWDDPSSVFETATNGFWARDRGFWDNIGSAFSKSGWLAVDLFSAPAYYVQRSAKTLLRVHDLAHEEGDPFFNFGTSAEWAKAWDDAKVGSLGQMLYLDIAGNPKTGARNDNYAFLDDSAEQQEFFSGNENKAAFLLSGSIDFVSSILGDPLMYAGGAGGAARVARLSVTAEDVARASDKVLEGAALTGKQRALRTAVKDIAQASETGESGTTALIARSEFLRRSQWSEPIAYFQAGIDSRLLPDAAERLAAREDVLWAAMGDQAALERIGGLNTRLRNELEMIRKDPTTFDIGPWLDEDIINTDPAGAVDQIVKAANDDPVLQRTLQDAQQWYADLLAAGADTRPAVNAIQSAERAVRRAEDDLSKMAQAGQGVEAAGSSLNGVGDLGGRVIAKADVKAITKTGLKASFTRYNRGQFLRPVNIVTGEYLPGVISLSQPEKSLDLVTEAVDRAIVALRPSSSAVRANSSLDTLYQDQVQRLRALQDEFVSSGVGAAGRGSRQRIVDQINAIINDGVAAKYGIDREQFATIARKRAESHGHIVDAWANRLYRALKADPNLKTFALSDGAEEFVLDVQSPIARRLIEQAQAVENASRSAQGAGQRLAALGGQVEQPVLRSQLQETAVIADARELQRMAHYYSLNGFAGHVVRGAAEAGYRVTQAAAAANNFFKFAALFRLAYPMRVQVDTQARLLAMLNPMVYLGQALGGVGNAAYNWGKKVSLATSIDLEERFRAAARLADLDDILRDVDADAFQAFRGRERLLAKHEARTVKQQFDELRPRLPSGRAKPMSQQQKDAFRAQLQADYDAKTALLVQERDTLLAQANLGRMNPDQYEAMLEQRRFFQERLAEPLRGVGDKKTVRVRKTVAARHIGQGVGISLTGRYWERSLSARLRSAYNSPEEYLRSLRSIDAEDSTASMMGSRMGYELEHTRGTGQWAYAVGTDGNETDWQKAYERLVDRQTVNDALARKILENEVEPGVGADAVVSWLQNAPEGQAYLRDMRRYGGVDWTAEELYAEASEHLEALLPHGSRVREAALNNRFVSRADMAETFKDPAARPTIPFEQGREARWYSLDEARRGYEMFRSKYFNWASVVPENMLGRHPFYQARFSHHADRLLKGIDEDRLTAAQIDTVRQKAAYAARKDVGRYLFDTSRQSNIGHAMRFISPFYAAWADTMVKWGRIFAEKPEVLVAGSKLPMAANSAFMVTDENGNLVDKSGYIIDPKTGERTDQRINPLEGYIHLPALPRALQAWSGQRNMKFTKDSANIIFQGDPFWLPGNGPLVTLPASMVVNSSMGAWYPEEDDHSASATIMRYLLPFGPEAGGAGEVFAGSFTPSWAEAARNWFDENQTQSINEFNTLYAQEYTREKMTGDVLDPVERFDKVAKQTRNSMFLRFVGTFVAPVSLQNNSPLEFYVQRYHDYIAKLGPEAGRDKFLEDYPEYLSLTVSLSANETGLTANDETATQMQKYSDEMRVDPSKAWVWAGASNLAPGFNSAVYSYQRANGYRTARDRQDMVKQVNITEGWQRFTAFDATVDDMLNQLGITSSQKAAEPLMAAKRAYVERMAQENPDWYAEYSGSNAGGNAQALAQYIYDNLPRMAQQNDPALGADAFVEYFATREAFRNVLRQVRASQEGVTDPAAIAALAPASITSQAVEDAGIKDLWEAAMTDLARRNPAFQVAWSRGLRNDTLQYEVG